MLGILFITFFVLLFIGMPIAMTMGIACIFPVIFNMGASVTVTSVIRGIIGGADTTPILAVPLFILSGVIMSVGGISKKIFDVFAYFIGNRTGGMPCAVIITCLFYGAISGSGPATTAAVGAMTIPILVSLGYDKVFSAALVATAGGLGIIIPPSIPFVLYGMSTGSSIGKLFIAGILPGILIAMCLMFYAFFYCKIKGEDKEKIELNYRLLKSRSLFIIIKDSFWALLSPVIILGGIYSGKATPTEVAVISVVYSLLISVFIYKSVKISSIIGHLRNAVRSYAPLCFLLALATAFGRTLAIIRTPGLVADFVISSFGSKISFLLVINLIFLFMGMVMDTTPAILILSPILMPVIKGFNIDPIHFGVIMIVNLAIGFVTPPFGVNLFVASPMVDTPVMKLGSKVIPFIISFLVALAMITYIPQISLLLL